MGDLNEMQQSLTIGYENGVLAAGFAGKFKSLTANER